MQICSTLVVAPPKFGVRAICLAQFLMVSISTVVGIGVPLLKASERIARYDSDRQSMSSTRKMKTLWIGFFFDQQLALPRTHAGSRFISLSGDSTFLFGRLLPMNSYVRFPILNNMTSFHRKSVVICVKLPRPDTHALIRSLIPSRLHKQSRP